MKLGYSKMNQNNTTTTNINNAFPQRSRSKKEFAFYDRDVEFSRYSRKKSQTYQNHQPSNSINGDDDVDDDENKKREDVERMNNARRERNLGASLRRNFSVSAATTTYQKNRGIDRQSSTRSIQGAVKRAFSMSLRRSTSVNSDSYCRIHDQSSNLEDDGDTGDVEDDGCSNYRRNDINGASEKGSNVDESDNNGDSMESTSKDTKKSKKNKDEQNNGKKNVGSRVIRAWKRLFSS